MLCRNLARSFFAGVLIEPRWRISVPVLGHHNISVELKTLNFDQATSKPLFSPPPPRLTVSFMLFNRMHTFKNLLLSCQCAGHFLKSHHDNCLANLKRAIRSGFCLGTLPWMPFLPSFFHFVESWELTFTEASQLCRTLHVVMFFCGLLDESPVCS